MAKLKPQELNLAKREDERRRGAFEHMVKVTKEQAERSGNGHKVTEEQIRRELQPIAESGDRGIEKARRNRDGH